MADTEYISKESALACFGDWIDRYGHEHTADEMVEYQKIEELPAADVRPVVQGAWERPKGSTTRSWIFVCSKCGDRAYFPVPKYFPKGCGYSFCPNCGADMREVTP